MGVGAAILAISYYAVKKLASDKASFDRISRFAKLVVNATTFSKTASDSPVTAEPFKGTDDTEETMSDTNSHEGVSLGTKK